MTYDYKHLAGHVLFSTDVDHPGRCDFRRNEPIGDCEDCIVACGPHVDSQRERQWSEGVPQ